MQVVYSALCLPDLLFHLSSAHFTKHIPSVFPPPLFVKQLHHVWQNYLYDHSWKNSTDITATVVHIPSTLSQKNLFWSVHRSICHLPTSGWSTAAQLPTVLKYLWRRLFTAFIKNVFMFSMLNLVLMCKYEFNDNSFLTTRAILTLKELGGGIHPPRHFLLYLSRLLFFRAETSWLFFL